MADEGSRAALERRLGYRFRDVGLLEMALTHRSWANEQGVDRHYERIEFLGDAVLDLVVAQWLYDNLSSLSEGELSRLKSHAVSEPVLAGWAERLGLGRLLQLGVGEERSGGRGKPSLLADSLEAVLGAIFLDGGLAAVREVSREWLESVLPGDAESLPGLDAKTELQELVQGRGAELPDYRLVAQEGPDHRKRFHVECWLAGERLGWGAGSSKKQAEQRAARAALAALREAAASPAP